MTVFVINANDERMMPTARVGHVRHLLKDGKAKIINRHPFTIKLTYKTTNYTQPIELCIDTGYSHIGVSVKSEKREYLARQYDLLSDEKQRHDNQRKYRRTRRNRLRYRKKRFNNRAIPKGWLAPSLKHKAECHIDLIKRIYNNCPISNIYLELGQFDTQLLEALNMGKEVDHQHGERYGIATLREAVFQRDNYICLFCGKGLKDGVILHAHHVYFWKGRHGNRLSELATCCYKCHTPSNHKPGGKLYGYDKKMKQYTGAAFMNSVKWYIYNQVKAFASSSVHITYGAATKVARSDLKLDKSHINDAYSMGKFHPSLRAPEEYFKKRRRNNRCLEKFYDAKYIDLRDGNIKAGKDLGCERTNRRELRNSPKSLRQYHSTKVSKGRRSIRKQRYIIQPGDVVLYNNYKYLAKGCQNNGTYVVLSGLSKPVSLKKCKLLFHCSGWQPVVSIPPLIFAASIS